MCYKCIGRNPSSYNTPNGIFAFIVIVVKGGNQHLQRSFRIYCWRRNSIDDRLKEWLQAHTLIVRIVHCYTIAANGIEHMKVEVAIASCKLKKQVLRPFINLVNSGITAVNFIDDKNRF